MTQNQVDSQIKSITDQLIKKYHAQKVILFGSTAGGKMTPDPDLDFLVIKDDNREFHQRVVDVYKLVEKNIAADFIVYTPKEVENKVKIGDPFIKSILVKGRVLYG